MFVMGDDVQSLFDGGNSKTLIHKYREKRKNRTSLIIVHILI